MYKCVCMYVCVYLCVCVSTVSVNLYVSVLFWLQGVHLWLGVWSISHYTLEHVFCRVALDYYYEEMFLREILLI